MSPLFVHLSWTLGLFVGVVVTAAVVNRMRPTQKPRVRRVVIFYALYLIALGGGTAFESLGIAKWAAGFGIAAQLLQIFTLINLVTTFGIFALLPFFGVSLPLIATDLLIGIGYIASTFAVFSQHGLNPTSALVSGAVVSAVLAISLQSTLGNILGGVALQLDGSIQEGDWIQLENGKQGKVRSVRWRHTVVETRDWSTMVVPNAELLGGNITLLGKRNGALVPQRMWVWFNVDFRYNPSKVMQTVTDALCASPIANVATDPKPNVVCMDFAKDQRESFATFAVRYWLTDLAADDPTSSLVRTRIYTALQRAAIPLAMPAHTAFVEMHDENRTKKRLEREAAAHLAALKNVHLFRSFTEAELRTLADGMSHVVYAPGEKITRQGAVAHWLYIMTAGTAEIRTQVQGASDPVVVARIAAPDFFGEMGLMTGEPRTADVIATSDVDCFRLGKDTFELVLLKRPAIAHELSEKLATRRVELLTVREGLDANAQKARHASERERILGAIKTFFGL